MARVSLSMLLVGILRGAVIFGGGETISHLAELDLSAEPELIAMLGTESPALGWKYEYFSIFFLDVWTGGAELVLYDGADNSRYAPLSAEALQELTGRDEASFTKPFLYRVPLGWIVFGPLFVVAGAGTWRRMRELA